MDIGDIVYWDCWSRASYKKMFIGILEHPSGARFTVGGPGEVNFSLLGLLS